MAGGFRPIQDISGNSYTGKVQTFFVPASHATLLSVGDLATVTGDADPVTGEPTVDASSAGTGNPITGPIIGIGPNISNLEQKGLPAGIEGFVQLAIDPNIIMEAEISNGSIATTNVQQNAAVVVAVATQTGGLVNSNMTINAGTFKAGTDQVRIVKLKDGDVGSGVTVICRINESTVKQVTGV